MRRSFRACVVLVAVDIGCLADEARTVSELAGTADTREGLAAVIERRAPRFRGR